MGLHSGPAIVGNIGTSTRMDYTAVGDTVNTAQRLENLASELLPDVDVAILLSRSTASVLPCDIALVPLGDHQLRGRGDLVQVFTFSILLSTAATLLPYVVSSAAWLVRGTGAVSRAIAALALAYSLYALSGIGTEALAWGAVLILSGLPLYAWMRRRRVATAP